MVHADLLDNEIDAAKELNNNGYHRAAGVVAGVVLESHLKAVATRLDTEDYLLSDRNPKLSEYNDHLKKHKVVNTATWGRIKYFASIRNQCAHDDEEAPTKDEVNTLIKGVNEITKTVGNVQG